MISAKIQVNNFVSVPELIDTRSSLTLHPNISTTHLTLHSNEIFLFDTTSK